MATLVISIEVPPIGELEISGDGSSPTDAQMDEETRAPEVSKTSSRLTSHRCRTDLYIGRITSHGSNCSGRRFGRSSTITCCLSQLTLETPG
jgi:hypothetical protein